MADFPRVVNWVETQQLVTNQKGHQSQYLSLCPTIGAD